MAFPTTTVGGVKFKAYVEVFDDYHDIELAAEDWSKHNVKTKSEELGYIQGMPQCCNYIGLVWRGRKPSKAVQKELVKRMLKKYNAEVPVDLGVKVVEGKSIYFEDNEWVVE